MKNLLLICLFVIFSDKVTGTYKGKKVYTGSQGGKYYINSNGNKTYIQD